MPNRGTSTCERCRRGGHGSPAPDGAAIRLHRQALGMSQSALARKAGYSAAYLCQIENGLAHTIPPWTLKRIQRALGNPHRQYLVISPDGGPAPDNPDLDTLQLADVA